MIGDMNEDNPFGLQSIMRNKIQADRAEQMKTSSQLTLGELILKIEQVSPTYINHKEKEEDKIVKYDFGYFKPTFLMSWRGSYCELAIGYSEKEKNKTVKEFLKELKEAIGKTYQGYKGGDFVMGKNTPIWVANYGECPDTAIVDVLEREWEVILITAYIEY